MEIKKGSRSGQQENVGSELEVPEVVQACLALPMPEQRELLLALAPRIVPRLDDLSRADYLQQLSDVELEERLSTELENPPQLSREEAMEEVLVQSLGAQKHILHMLSTRHLANLEPAARQELLDELEEVLKMATRGVDLPTVH